MPKQRKYEDAKSRVKIGKAGYKEAVDVYYKPSTKGTNFDFSRYPSIVEYRKKAFAKQEPQSGEYYEGELVYLKAVGLD